jgi:hypothetical protein
MVIPAMIVGISIHLDHDEACTRTVCTSKVDRALVAGDIEALDTASARLERSGTSGSEQKWEGSDLHDEYRGKVSAVNKKEGACPLFMPPWNRSFKDNVAVASYPRITNSGLSCRYEAPIFPPVRNE